VSALLEQGGLGVLDLFACRWWSKEAWLDRFVRRTGFAVEDFIRVVSSDDEQLHPGIWVHTRGLRKFGRPDLQVKHVPGPWPGDNPMTTAACKLLNSLSERLCQGAMLGEGETAAFTGLRRRCTFLLSPDDSGSPHCHFGNEVLEVIDLVRGKAGSDLNRLLGELAGR